MSSVARVNWNPSVGGWRRTTSFRVRARRFSTKHGAEFEFNIQAVQPFCTNYLCNRILSMLYEARSIDYCCNSRPSPGPVGLSGNPSGYGTKRKRVADNSTGYCDQPSATCLAFGNYRVSCLITSGHTKGECGGDS